LLLELCRSEAPVPRAITPQVAESDRAAGGWNWCKRIVNSISFELSWSCGGMVFWQHFSVWDYSSSCFSIFRSRASFFIYFFQTRQKSKIFAVFDRAMRIQRMSTNKQLCITKRILRFLPTHYRLMAWRLIALVRRRFFSPSDIMLCSVTANAVTGFGLSFLPQAVASSPSAMQGCVAINHAQLKSYFQIVMGKIFTFILYTASQSACIKQARFCYNIIDCQQPIPFRFNLQPLLALCSGHREQHRTQRSFSPTKTNAA
jgi:hypothetical protein